LLALPALLLLVGCDWEDFGGSERYTADFQHSYPLKEGGRLTLENFNGAIEISGWDENSIEIVGTKYAATPELLEALEIDIQASADAVYIRTIRPSGRRGNLGARYTIRVPRRLDLDRITSSNGSIRVTDVEGTARLKTSNGPVRTSGLRGSLDIQTSNGSVEIQRQQGSVVAKTSNGRVRAEEIRGAFEAGTSNGSIHVQLARAEAGRAVKLETTNGSVELTLPPDNRNDVRISTSNGGITVRAPGSIGARLDARTSNSSISTDFDVKTAGAAAKNHLQGTIGSGGALIELSTTNGGIRLLRL
jgi:DUF4097 and DUF4098 domain-containing protein YvlB